MASYVIITPAYNEGQYLGTTIRSVTSQTQLPARWVIVDDGSEDDTQRIAKEACDQYPWIQYRRRQRCGGDTYYASNVYAIQEGLQCLEGVSYDYLAILDADMSLPPDYYARIVQQFERCPRLGLASGVRVERANGGIRQTLHDRRSSPKAIMVFRRQCYEEIGGFLPLKYGGEDTCACFAARQVGWQTWSFPDLVTIHHRPVGEGHIRSVLAIRFRMGLCEYFIGSSALFVLAKSLRRCWREPPFAIGGLMRVAGYLAGFFKREPRQVPEELVRFIRREQWGRLVNFNRVPEVIEATGEDGVSAS